MQGDFDVFKTTIITIIIIINSVGTCQGSVVALVTEAINLRAPKKAR
jgi:hypothetical protein